MGIFGALTTAVTGMQAQSYALQNISGNIANSQTTAYKRIDTSFEDMIQDNIASKQNAGGVMVFSRATNSVQGDVQTASIGTFMAVNGDGYFVVQKPNGIAGNTPTFSGINNFTRRGDFQLDKNGYLVNGSGYYLEGIKLDATGNPIGSTPQVLQFQTEFDPAVKTTSIEYHANLAKTPHTANYKSSVPGSELLDGSSVQALDGSVQATDALAFTNSTTGGGAVTCYDSAGGPVNVQLRWGKTSNTSPETWNLFYMTNSQATGTQAMWQRVNVLPVASPAVAQSFQFDSSGKMTQPAAGTFPMDVTVDGDALGSVQVHLSGGLTQYDDPNGVVQVNLLQQDGYAAGNLQSISVNDKGRIVGSYTNGRTTELAEIPLAKFNGPNYLKHLDGGAFAATDESGAAIYGASGKIVGSSLEGSNTDIADEFTKLIVTQQAYSANTRVITTSNTMVQDLLSMLR